MHLSGMISWSASYEGQSHACKLPGHVSKPIQETQIAAAQGDIWSRYNKGLDFLKIIKNWIKVSEKWIQIAIIAMVVQPHLKRKYARTELGHGVRVGMHGLQRRVDMVGQHCSAA